MRTAATRYIFLIINLYLLTAHFACIPTVSIEGANCPCPVAGGYQCCKGVCISDRRTCVDDNLDSALNPFDGEGIPDTAVDSVTTDSSPILDSDTGGETETETETEKEEETETETVIAQDSEAVDSDTGTHSEGDAETESETPSEPDSDTEAELDTNSDTATGSSDTDSEGNVGDAGQGPMLAKEGESCSASIQCEKDLVCHGWKIANMAFEYEATGPLICVRRCEYGKLGDCDFGENCRSISFIDGERPLQTNILHTTACVTADTPLSQCESLRCPSACGGHFPSETACYFNSISICSVAILPQCGLICGRNILKDCGEAGCTDEGNVAACAGARWSAAVTTCPEASCDICGSPDNIGREYCDEWARYRCFTVQYEDSESKCGDMCFRKWTGFCL